MVTSQHHPNGGTAMTIHHFSKLILFIQTYGRAQDCRWTLETPAIAARQFYPMQWVSEWVSEWVSDGPGRLLLGVFWLSQLGRQTVSVRARVEPLGDPHSRTWTQAAITSLISMNLISERADMPCIVACMFQNLILSWNSANLHEKPNPASSSNSKTPH